MLQVLLLILSLFFLLIISSCFRSVRLEKDKLSQTRWKINQIFYVLSYSKASVVFPQRLGVVDWHLKLPLQPKCQQFAEYWQAPFWFSFWHRPCYVRWKFVQFDQFQLWEHSTWWVPLVKMGIYYEKLAWSLALNNSNRCAYSSGLSYSHFEQINRLLTVSIFVIGCLWWMQSISFL